MRKKMKNLVFKALAIVMFSGLAISASTPRVINFQGRLTNIAGKAETGTKSIEFKIYDASTAGSELWTETQTVTLDDNGLYNVFLGAVNPLSLNFDSACWLGINVEGDGEMSSRFRIVPTAQSFYSIKSGTANFAGGVDWSNIANRPSGLDDGDDTGSAGEDEIGNYHIIAATITAAELASNIDAGGIGFNADKVDGYHASSFAQSVHTHSGNAITTAVSTAAYAVTASSAVYSQGSGGVDWSNIANRPSGLDDGDDTGSVGADEIGNYHIIAATITVAELAANIDARGIGFIAAEAVNASTLSGRSYDAFVSTQGGVMSGDLNLSGNKITNLITPTAASDAATKNYVDAAVGSGSILSSTNTFTGYNTFGELEASSITISGANVVLTATATFANNAAMLSGQDASAFQLTDADLDDLADGTLTGSKVGSGIAAANIADGSVSDAEYQYMGNVTSDVQTQMNAVGIDTGTLRTDIDDTALSTGTLLTKSSATATYLNINDYTVGGDAFLADNQTFTGYNAFGEIEASSITITGANVVLTATATYSLNSDKLDGYEASSFAQLGGTQTFTGQNTLKKTKIFVVSGGALEVGKNDSSATGLYSMAMGQAANASAHLSVAMGRDTTASGSYSMAIGQGSTASGECSVAMGNNTTASGDTSTTMGLSSKASGAYSTSMGYDTSAVGDYSFAAGRKSSATVAGAFAISDSEDAVFTVGTTVGFGARFAGGFELTGGRVNISSNVFIAGISSATTYYGDGSNLTGLSSGGGGGDVYSASTQTFTGQNTFTNMVNVSSKTKITVTSGGAAEIGKSDCSATGLYGVAMGKNTTASGGYSLAGGLSSVASGGYSFAFGYGAEATGSYAVALGENVSASGDQSFSAGGNGSKATAQYAVALGRAAMAQAQESFAFGHWVKTTGKGTMALGDSQNSLYTVSTADSFGARFAGGYEFTGGDVAISSDLNVTGSVTVGSVLKTKTNTIADGDATPDVSGGNIFVTSANTGATEITDLDNPVVGSIVHIIGGSDTNSSTIADSGNFALSGAWTASVDDVLILYIQADNDYIELGRVNN